jgi:hypothetical protein
VIIINGFHCIKYFDKNVCEYILIKIFNNLQIHADPSMGLSQEVIAHSSTSSLALQLLMSFGLLNYFFHFFLSYTLCFQFFTPIFLRSFLTSSSHLSLGLTFGLVAYGFHLYMLLATFSSGILSTRPNQLKLLLLMCLTILVIAPYNDKILHMTPR